MTPCRPHSRATRRRIAAAGAAFTAALLAACASPGPTPTPPQPMTSAALGATGTDTPWPATDWWTAWGDPGLDRLVATAFAQQPGLEAAQARVRRAAATQAGVDASDAPSAQFTAETTGQRFSEHGLIPPPYAGTHQWLSSLQVGAAWSPDLSGRQRAALDAAVGQTRAAEADAQAARVLLAGQVAATHFQLAQLLDQRAVVTRAQAQREQVAAIVRERVDAGLDTAIERQQATGQVAQAQVDGLALDDAIARTRHALAELTGQGPEALANWSPTLAQARVPAPPAALPADLLGRRADLVAARWRVEAASRGVAEARAGFYPSVDLTAFVGLSSLGLDKLLDLGSRTYGVGPAIHLPLFDAGRLRANLGGRRAELDAAVAAYDAALLRALREVADELGSGRTLAAQQERQDEARRAASAAYELALQRYRAGLGNYLVVLTAQNNVLQQERAASALRGRRLAADVALTMALGGGYVAEFAVAALPATVPAFDRIAAFTSPSTPPRRPESPR